MGLFGFFNQNKNEDVALDRLPVSIDMHSHLLPGIDDGAPDVETSMQLIKGMHALGINRFIATPHVIGDLYRNTDESIEAALAKVQAGIDESGLPIIFSAAAEYMLDDFFMRMLRSQQPLRTLENKLLLVEIPYTDMPMNLEEMLFEIITEGYQPVLAHPERYQYLHRHMSEYKRLKDLGFLLQVNLLSLTGYYGKNVARAAKYILGNKLATFASSDLHHGRHLEALQQPHNLQVMHKYIAGVEMNSMLLGD